MMRLAASHYPKRKTVWQLPAVSERSCSDSVVTHAGVEPQILPKLAGADFRE